MSLASPPAGMAVYSRQRAIEEALEKVLDRGPEMFVGPCDEPGELCVWVIDGPHSDTRTGHRLSDIARELEVLLP